MGEWVSERVSERASERARSKGLKVYKVFILDLF